MNKAVPNFGAALLNFCHPFSANDVFKFSACFNSEKELLLEKPFKLTGDEKYNEINRIRKTIF